MVESHGIPTVCLSINLAISERIGAPRTVFVRFPHGASFGEPGNVSQHRAVLRDLFWALQDCDEPGEIVRPMHRWRRSRYDPVPAETFSRPLSRASKPRSE